MSLFVEHCKGRFYSQIYTYLRDELLTQEQSSGSEKRPWSEGDEPLKEKGFREDSRGEPVTSSDYGISGKGRMDWANCERTKRGAWTVHTMYSFTHHRE